MASNSEADLRILSAIQHLHQLLYEGFKGFACEYRSLRESKKKMMILDLRKVNPKLKLSFKCHLTGSKQQSSEDMFMEIIYILVVV